MLLKDITQCRQYHTENEPSTASSESISLPQSHQSVSITQAWYSAKAKYRVVGGNLELCLVRLIHRHVVNCCQETLKSFHVNRRTYSQREAVGFEKNNESIETANFTQKSLQKQHHKTRIQAAILNLPTVRQISNRIVDRPQILELFTALSLKPWQLNPKYQCRIKNFANLANFENHTSHLAVKCNNKQQNLLWTSHRIRTKEKGIQGRVPWGGGGGGSI